MRAAILLKPVIRSTPDDWAKRNRTYKPSTGRPGPRDVGYTPYMIDFERSFDIAIQVDVYGARYDSSVLVTSAQMGKTDSVLDIMGWTMDQRPAPLMYVGPNKDFLHKEIEPRLMEMLLGTPSLAQKMATGKRTSKFRKTVGGVPIALNWAGSAASLAGMAAKIVLVDELDRMMASVQGEGDPYTMLEGRGFSFRDRMRAAISTPTLGFVDIYRCLESGLEFWRQMEAEDVQSAIWRHYREKIISTISSAYRASTEGGA